RLINTINSDLDSDLAVRAVFEAPTVAELATRVGESPGRRAPLVAQRRPDVIPLSYAQQRLWFLEQLQGPSSIYNMAVALRINGCLDTDALGLALADVVNRHESLRTLFAAPDGVPRQVVVPSEDVDFGWQVVDVCGAFGGPPQPDSVAGSSSVGPGRPGLAELHCRLADRVGVG
ncbi:condensation domain-containing protein, partial [Mycolicibacterium fortuitum]|uniref:condensation domain-containing protein n=1 Tax=Mycolicibacterium fortuitum TaxID=1766 RepID=UPI0039B12345